MSAEQVGPAVRHVPSHRRPGQPEPIAPAAVGLLAVVLAALAGGVIFGVLIGAIYV